MRLRGSSDELAGRAVELLELAGVAGVENPAERQEATVYALLAIFAELVAQRPAPPPSAPDPAAELAQLREVVRVCADELRHRPHRAAVIADTLARIVGT